MSGSGMGGRLAMIGPQIKKGLVRRPLEETRTSPYKEAVFGWWVYSTSAVAQVLNVLLCNTQRDLQFLDAVQELRDVLLD